MGRPSVLNLVFLAMQWLGAVAWKVENPEETYGMAAIGTLIGTGGGVLSYHQMQAGDDEDGDYGDDVARYDLGNRIVHDDPDVDRAEVSNPLQARISQISLPENIDDDERPLALDDSKLQASPAVEDGDGDGDNLDGLNDAQAVSTRVEMAAVTDRPPSPDYRPGYEKLYGENGAPAMNDDSDSTGYYEVFGVDSVGKKNINEPERYEGFLNESAEVTSPAETASGGTKGDHDVEDEVGVVDDSDDNLDSAGAGFDTVKRHANDSTPLQNGTEIDTYQTRPMEQWKTAEELRQEHHDKNQHLSAQERKQQYYELLKARSKDLENKLQQMIAL